jgi:hypothetical protein
MSDEHEFTDDEGRESTEVVAPPVDDDSWASLLNFLHLSRGFDFHGYKPNTLARRIRKRMSALGLEGYGTYQDYLEVHPHEFLPGPALVGCRPNLPHPADPELQAAGGPNSRLECRMRLR